MTGQPSLVTCVFDQKVIYLFLHFPEQKKVNEYKLPRAVAGGGHVEKQKEEGSSEPTQNKTKHGKVQERKKPEHRIR